MVNLWNVRTLLSVPAHDWHKVESAFASNADLVHLDLEDSVPEADYPRARENVFHALDKMQRPFAVRCRNFSDVMLFNGKVSLLILPRVESARSEMLPECGSLVAAIIETAYGVEHAEEILKGYDGVLLGYYDLRASLGYWATGWNSAMDYARNRVMYAAAIHEIPFFDGPFPGHVFDPGNAGSIVLGPNYVDTMNEYNGSSMARYRELVDEASQRSERIFRSKTGELVTPPQLRAMQVALRRCIGN